MMRLRIGVGTDGGELLPTAEEHERMQKEHERREKQQAMARIDELERELVALRSGARQRRKGRAKR